MSSNPQENMNLTLGDRINYPFIVANLLLKFGDVIIQPEGSQSQQQVREAAMTLFNFIPDIWLARDSQFKTDVEMAVVTRDIDDRPIWCGARVGKEGSRRKVIKEILPYRLINACINVLQRRGYLSKIVYTEEMVVTPESLEQEGKTNEEGEQVLDDKQIDDLNKLKNMIDAAASKES